MNPPEAANWTTLDEFAECGEYHHHDESEAIYAELWRLMVDDKGPTEYDDRVSYNAGSANNLAKNWDRLKPSTQRIIFDALKDEMFDEQRMPTDEPHDHADNPGGATGRCEDDPNW